MKTKEQKEESLKEIESRFKLDLRVLFAKYNSKLRIDIDCSKSNLELDVYLSVTNDDLETSFLPLRLKEDYTNSYFISF